MKLPTYPLTPLRLLLSLTLLLTFALPASAAPVAAPIAQGVQRIQFAPGASSATLDGSVGNGQGARYVLRALAGQTMSVQLQADNSGIFVIMTRADGILLGSSGVGQSWSGSLPVTGDYYITIGAPPQQQSANFQLWVEISYNASPAPQPEPQRIRFAPGAISAQVTGTLPASSVKQYILGAASGQMITIQSWTSGGPYRFAVTGRNGTPLGGANGGESWAGSLPSTQDYYITVETPTDVAPVSYALTITIVTPAPQPLPTPVPVTAQRIQFPPNATFTNVWGYVDVSNPQRYVLRALAGQTLTVRLRTAQDYPARITITTAQGAFLGAANVNEVWSGVLPATQDYYLTIQAPADSSGDNYSLWVGIE